MTDCIVFDFDFTIAKTVENIWVWSPRGCNTYNNKTYYPIHPQELSNIGIGDDETINNDSFTEFYDINLDKTIIIKPVIINLAYYTNFLNIHVQILSARPNNVKNKIFHLLDINGINTKNISFTGLSNSFAEAKIQYINNILLQDSENLIIYEDSIRVLELAHKAFNFKTKLECVLVKHNQNNIILNYNV